MDLKIEINETDSNSILLDSVYKSKDNTTKYLWKTKEDLFFESVLVELENRQLNNILCISSQIGCLIGCHFCKTSKLGFIRNLSFEEMKDQILKIIQYNLNMFTSIDKFEISISAIGEPLLNYENLIKFLKFISHYNINNKKIIIRISTVGIVKNIYKLIDEDIDLPIKLQISLHATNDQDRRNIIPYSTISPNTIEEILIASKEYAKKKKEKIIVKYLLFKDVNDKPENIYQLISLLNKNYFNVHLARLNPIEDFNFKPSSLEQMKKCQYLLKKEGFETQLSISKGLDIEAGCGQLTFAHASKFRI